MKNVDLEVKNYVESKEIIGALLVKGKWGCGKTYLLKNVLNEYRDSKQYCIVFCSLFGVESVGDIEKRVKQELLYYMAGGNFSEETKEKIDKGKRAVKSLTAITSEVSKLAPFARGLGTAFSVNLLDFVDIKQKVKRGNAEAELVVVFDDLERCKIDIVLLMGVINSFVEGKGIKTIIVADEDKVSSVEYLEFKEKVVSRTIQLSNDYRLITEQIIRDFHGTEEGYVSFLNTHFSLIVEAFEESESNNIRSLKACVIDFERFYAAWCSIGGLSDKDLAFIMYDYFAVCYEVKAGRYQRDENFGYAFAGTKLGERYAAWNEKYKLDSLIEWVTNGEWSLDVVKSEIKHRFGECDFPADRKLLTYYFWDLDWDIICTGLPVVLENGYQGNLVADEEIRLIVVLYDLVTNDIPLPCEVNYKKLREGWSNRVQRIVAGVIEEPQRHRFFDSDEKLRDVDDDLYFLYRDVEMLEWKNSAYSTRLSLLNCYSNSDTSELSKYRNKAIPSFDSNLRDVFYQAYCAGDNMTKRLLIRSLAKVWFTDKECSTFDDMKETIANIERLNDDLTKYSMQCEDIFTKCVVGESIKMLPDIISPIQEELKSEAKEALNRQATDTK